MVTINAAAAMDLDAAIGSLEIGKRADLVVLSGDPLDPDRRAAFLDNEVHATLIDGLLVWCDPGQAELCGSFPTAVPLVVSDPHAAVAGGSPVEAPNDDRVSITASAELEPARAAIDGDRGSGWVSGGGPPGWIEFDFGEVREISGLRLWVDQSPAGFTRHRILGGLEAAPSDQLALIEGDTEWGEVLSLDDLAWSARYLRIETIESPSWVAWLEIEVEFAG